MKTVSVVFLVHYDHELEIVIHVDFDCGINFYHEAPTKVGHINQKRKNISGSCGKPKCIPGNGQHDCSIDEQHTSNIVLNQYSLKDLDPAALVSFSLANVLDSLPNQYPQRANHQPRTGFYPVFSSLRPMDSKKKRLCVSFALFQRNYIRDGKLNITVVGLKKWVILGNPKQLMAIY